MNEETGNRMYRLASSHARVGGKFEIGDEESRSNGTDGQTNTADCSATDTGITPTPARNTRNTHEIATDPLALSQSNRQPRLRVRVGTVVTRWGTR